MRYPRRMVAVRSAGACLVVALLGCGSDSEPAHGKPPPHDAPAGCEPGEVELDGGACSFVAGIDPNQCGEGFAAQGERSCVEVMPPDRCSPGQMAIPGEMACHPVAQCGAAPYGDIPVDAS